MADASDEETVRFVPGVVSATHVSSGSDHLKSSLLAIICTLEAHHRLKELSLTGSKARSEKLESNDSPSIPRPESGRVGGRLLLIAAVLSRITELYDSQTVRDCTAPEHLQLLAELYSFFTLLRACLDDVALSITVFSKREGQLPTRFSRLIDLYQKKPHRFEPHIATALSADMSWFRHMRSIRDTLVHGYAQSIIYADETLMFDLIKDQPSGQVQRMFDGDKRRLGIDILDLTAHYVRLLHTDHPK